MSTKEDTENRLVQFVFHEGTTHLGVVRRVSRGGFTFPFRLDGVMGRSWLMQSRGSGGPKSIPTYAEVLR